MLSRKPLSNRPLRAPSKRDRNAALEKVRELARLHRIQPIEADPVYFVHQYASPEDQEVVGLISALMAFGQVKSIHTSLKKILALLGPQPARFLKSFEGRFDPHEDLESWLKIQHRWVRGEDLILLMETLSRALREYGSIENLFSKGSPTDVSAGLGAFSRRLLDMSGRREWSRGFRHFFPSPEDGSACKRLCMYLRWMVRPSDGVDLGLWKQIPPSSLVVPLDTHIYQFAQKYRLSRYANPNWKMALEITEFLKTLDPEDPVRYDYILCHHGMEVGWLK